MHKTKPLIPNQNGKPGQKPLFDKAKLGALKEMRAVEPKYLVRGIRPDGRRMTPVQYEKFGLFTDSMEDVYKAILSATAFDVFPIGAMDSKPESDWKTDAEAWRADQQKTADLKTLAELKAKYPEL